MKNEKDCASSCTFSYFKINYLVIMKKIIFFVALLFITMSFLQVSVTTFTATNTAEYEIGGAKIKEHSGEYTIHMELIKSVRSDITISNYCGRTLSLTASASDCKTDSNGYPYLLHCTSSNGYKYDVKLYLDKGLMNITDYKRNRLVKISIRN